MYLMSKIESKVKLGLVKMAKLSSAIALTVGILFAGLASAAVINDVTYVGTWDSVGSGNPLGVGGPGMSAGQRYVIRFSYDLSSIVTPDVDVLDAFFNPSGEKMSTINLNDAGNSLDIFVPMEGFDAGSPFIYNQNEGTHFPIFIANPTLNFIDGSDISDIGNIIGLEFEGDVFPGAGNNVIELFNTAPLGGPTNMVGQILNLDNFGIAASDTNGLMTAVELMVDAGPDIVYNAAALTKTATASVSQSNDLGAARSDGEDFVDFSWSPSGVEMGDSIAVAIADSGLVNTTDTSSWTASATEQMTDKADSDTLTVSYANAIPTVNASATANATGFDFTFSAADVDLAVNAIIGGFELLNFTAMVGAIDATTFFASLFSSGAEAYSNAELFTEFGVGAHNVMFSVMDLAGSLATTSVSFNTDAQPVPEPSAILLMLTSLMFLLIRQRLAT